MINLLVSWIISTILSTLAIIAATKIIKETPNLFKSFVAALLSNFLTVFVFSFIFLPIPYFFLVMGILIWIAVVKILLRFSWSHSFMIGILGYAIKFALDILGVSGWILMILGI
ncbi:MAG: hypothetical protein JSV92_05275 [archaeon]|nr:MAG: hypothetical protein JSV92_05275 [archaeon]